MFDSLPETKGEAAAVRSSAFSTAVMVHLGILLVIVSASVLAHVAPGDDPPPPSGSVLTIVDIGKLGDDPDAGGSPPALEQRPARAREVERPPEPEVVQPEPQQPEPAAIEADPFEPAESQPPEVTASSDSSGPEGDSRDGGEGDGTGVGIGSGGRPGKQGVPGGDPDGKNPYGGPGTSDDSPIVLSIGVEPPVIIVRVEPDYPPMARIARIEGEVILESVIGTDGRVESLRTLKAAHPFLDDAARKAVSKWIYRPATQNGRRVKVYLTIRVRFTLN